MKQKKKKKKKILLRNICEWGGISHINNTSLNKSQAWYIDGATNKNFIWFL